MLSPKRICHSPTMLLLKPSSSCGHGPSLSMLQQAHSPLVRSPLVPDAEVLMHRVLHVTFIAETLTYGERRGHEGHGRTRLSTCSPCQTQPAATWGTQQLHSCTWSKARKHLPTMAEVSSQTHPNHLTTYQSQGRTGARKGREGAGHRGPGPRAHWNFAGRRGRPVPGSASRWHPAGSPPAG